VLYIQVFASLNDARFAQIRQEAQQVGAEFLGEIVGLDSKDELLSLYYMGNITDDMQAYLNGQSPEQLRKLKDMVHPFRLNQTLTSANFEGSRARDDLTYHIIEFLDLVNDCKKSNCSHCLPNGERIVIGIEQINKRWKTAKQLALARKTAMLTFVMSLSAMMSDGMPSTEEDIKQRNEELELMNKVAGMLFGNGGDGEEEKQQADQ
jgi:hypothetical protein